MSKPNLTRTCRICGVQKPLAAFLQLGGPNGTSYGDICHSCRKINQEAANQEPDEGATSNTGVVIDSKSKVKAETDKREHRTLTQEQYYEEREKEADEINTQASLARQKAKEEKTHRQSFLEKRPVLETKKAKPKLASEPNSVAEKEQVTDLTAPFIDTQISGKLKYASSSIFQQFLNLLPDSPITRHSQQQKQQAQKKPPQSPKKTESQSKDKPAPSSEYIEKKWGPKSRG